MIDVTGLTSFLFDTIADIDEQAWDALIDGESISLRYGWLKSVEQAYAAGAIPKYFVIRRDDTIVGAAVCYLYGKSSKPVIDTLLLGRFQAIARRLGWSFQPILVCGQPKGYGAHFLIAGDVPESGRNSIRTRLLEDIEAFAATLKLPVLYSQVMKHEQALVQLLAERGYFNTPGFPLNYLDIEWESFDQYRQYIRKLKKKNIQAEINKSKRAGVTIEPLEDLDSCGDRVLELLNLNYQKYNEGSLPFTTAFLTRLKENLGDQVIFYGARKAGELTGVSIFLLNKTVAYPPFCGVDYDLAGKDSTYFQLLYNRPIEDAIAWKIDRIYFGNALYESKRRRGCKVSNTYLYYRPGRTIYRGPMKYLFQLHRAWMQRKLLGISEESGAAGRSG